jgi:MFS family permease
VLSLVILFMRLWIPESPRWLITHGRAEQAQAIVDGLEARFRSEGHVLKGPPFPSIRLRVRSHTPLSEVARTLIKQRRRTLVALSLMTAQAFFYNAIFFTYALVLTDFYGVRADHVGWYILPFAVGNVLGPIILGRFFDTIGRKPMLALTYSVSGVLLALSGWLFALGWLTATTQTVSWMVIFFFASAAASAAYLTAAETFPLEIRALAIAFFYAAGTGIGGIAAPWLFGVLIDTGSRGSLFGGYLLGAGLMLAAAMVVFKYGVDAERKSLEAVAAPLSTVD